MTALGHSRQFGRGLATSALPRSADIHQVSRHVSKVPIADNIRQLFIASFAGACPI
jgi:hypothetical protein